MRNVVFLPMNNTCVYFYNSGLFSFPWHFVFSDAAKPWFCKRVFVLRRAERGLHGACAWHGMARHGAWGAWTWKNMGGNSKLQIHRQQCPLAL